MKTNVKVYYELDLENFKAWSGGLDTLEEVKSRDKLDELENLIGELYFENGIGETELNDILWFERDWIFETLGISEEEEEL